MTNSKPTAEGDPEYQASEVNLQILADQATLYMSDPRITGKFEPKELFDHGGWEDH